MVMTVKVALPMLATFWVVVKPGWLCSRSNPNQAARAVRKRRIRHGGSSLTAPQYSKSADN